MPGYFDNIRWHVESEDFEEKTQDLASIHESYHALLNNQTSYGAVLALARAYSLANYTQAADRTLRSLESRCRTVHESYATYSAIQALAIRDPNIKGTARNLIGSQYDHYYHLADQVCCHIQNPLVSCMLYSGIACLSMQGFVLHEVLRVGIDAFSPGSVPYEEYPDARFFRLLSLFSRQVMIEAHRAALESVTDIGGVEIFDDSRDVLGLDDSFDPRLCKIYECAAYEHLRSVAVAAGVYALNVSGHLELYGAAQTEGNRLGLNIVFKPPSAQSARAVFDRERIVFHPLGLSASVRLLSSLDHNTLVRLRTNSHLDGLFFCVRQPGDIAAKYRLDRTTEWLISTLEPDKPQLFLRSRSDSQDNHVDMFLCPPSNLQAVMELATVYGATCNISLTSLLEPQSDWIGHIGTRLRCSFLIDISMRLFLTILAGQGTGANPVSVEYSLVVTDIMRKEGLTVSGLALRSYGFMSGTSAILPCSRIAGENWIRLMTQDPRLEAVAGDKGFGERVIEALVALDHCVTDEPYFGG